jgi:hypothetical protein
VCDSVCNFSVCMILYSLNMAQREPKHVAATESLINVCLFTDLFVYVKQRD